MIMYSQTVRTNPMLLATAEAFEGAVRSNPIAMAAIVSEAKERNVYGDKVLAERVENILYRWCILTQQSSHNDLIQFRPDT